MRKKLLFLFGGLLLLISAIFFRMNESENFDLNCLEQESGRSTAIIIIPGSKAKIPPFLDFFFRKFYEAYGVETGNDDWSQELRDFLGSTIPSDICIFSWPGGVTETFSIAPAARELARRLNETNRYSRLIFFGKSLGGLVAEKAANLLPPDLQVEKIIYVATPHASAHPDLPENTAITNIYSKNDSYLTLANRIFYFGNGKTEIENGINLEIPGLKHSEFNRNVAVEMNGMEKKLFEVYAEEMK